MFRARHGRAARATAFTWSRGRRCSTSAACFPTCRFVATRFAKQAPRLDAHSSPIVVLDSGLGGLTVVARPAPALPDEDILYFGDTARLPYGSKTAATVTGVRQADHPLPAGRCGPSTSSSPATPRRRWRCRRPGGVPRPVDQRRDRAGREGGGRRGGGQAGAGHRRHRDRGDGPVQGVRAGDPPPAQPRPRLLPADAAAGPDHRGRPHRRRPARAASRCSNTSRRWWRTELDVLVLGCTHYPMLKDVIGRDGRPEGAA